MQRKNYAQSTINTYISFLKQYAGYCKANNLNPKTDAEPYLQYLVKSKAAISTQNQAINAIKYYWENILGKEKQYLNIDRPLKNKSIPKVLSIEQVEEIMKRCTNLKHRTMLSMIYACGLRVGEICSLEVKDINGKRNSIHIKKGKGKKDRMVPIPESLLNLLRTYYKTYKPKVYLFEGQVKSGTTDIPAYSPTSIRKVLNRLAIQAGITIKVNPHTLRHSYATHLYEKGISLRSIQVLLGHNSSKTTEIYTHVSNSHVLNTPSPFDFLPSSSKFEENLEQK